MTLNKQTIPFQFSAGIETYLDDKSNFAPKVTNLENAIFTNPGSFHKRYGLTDVETKIDQSDGTILGGQALSTFQDQLLLFNGTNCYSRSNYQIGFNNPTWQDKGHLYGAINDSFSVVRNNSEQTNADMATIGGLNCYVWEDSRGGVRYSVLDSDTKNVIVQDTLLSQFGVSPKVFALQETFNANGSRAVYNQFVIIFVNSNLIQIARIYSNKLHIDPTISTVASDLNVTYAPVFDVCVSRGVITVDGAAPISKENIFVAYAAEFNSGADVLMYSVPKTIKISATLATSPNTMVGIPIGQITNALGYNAIAPPNLIRMAPIADISTAGEAVSDPSALIMWRDSNSLVWVGKIKTSVVGNLYGVHFNNSAIVPQNTFSNLTFAWDGIPYTDQIGLKIFSEQIPDATYNLNDSNWVAALDLNIHVHGEITAVGEFSNLRMCKGVSIYSRPFIQNGVMNIIVAHDSELQSTYFLLDQDLNVVSKINENVAGGRRSGIPAEIMPTSLEFGNEISTLFDDGSIPISNVYITTPISVDEWQFASLKKGKLISQDNQLFSLLGVSNSTLDYISPYQFYSGELNENLYIVSGVLQNYDGNRIQEAGFNLYPESQTITSAPMAVSINTVGSATSPTQSVITMVPGNRINPGDYFFVSAVQSNQKYIIFFQVDGDSGLAHNVAGFTSVVVNIQSYFTVLEVNTAVGNVLTSLGVFSIGFGIGSFLTVTNIANGATTGVVLGNVGVGSMVPGTYQYCTVWKYVDNKGRIHRSAPSIPDTYILGGDGNSSVTVSVPVLDLTNKDEIILEVYRTESLGSVFHLTTSITAPVFNTRNTDVRKLQISAIDTLSDTDLISRETLYTLGGVLDNSPPPACNFVTVYKNRLFVTGLDNKNLIQYSKTITPEEHDVAVGFNDALFIELSNQGGSIVALSVLDDKLIIFKESQIYVLVGDGPNNTGANSTFSEPQLISTDTGCSEPNSIQLMPNGLLFKSPKGIYLLDRSLQVSSIGQPVQAYNDLAIESAVLMPVDNEVRFITNGKALVYNYQVNQWSTFTNYEGVDSVIYKSILYLLKEDGRLYSEDRTSHIDTNLDGTRNYVSMMVETSNLQMAGILGFQRVYRLQLLGEMKTAHKLQIDVAYDFSPIYTQSTVFNADTIINQTYGTIGPYGTSNGGVYGGIYTPYQIEAHLKQQKCTACRFRIKDVQPTNIDSLIDGEGLTLSAFALQVGSKIGLEKLSGNKRLGSQ